jgi:hypothetical protein
LLGIVAAVEALFRVQEIGRDGPHAPVRSGADGYTAFAIVMDSKTLRDHPAAGRDAFLGARRSTLACSARPTSAGASTNRLECRVGRRRRRDSQKNPGR